MQVQKIRDEWQVIPETKDELKAMEITLGHKVGRFIYCLNQQEKDNYMMELSKNYSFPGGIYSF